MKRTIGIILASIVGIVLLGALFIAALSWAIFSPEPLPDRIVLELDLNRGIVEAVPDDPFLMLLERRQLRVRDVVNVLHRASEDERVVGLWVRGGNPLGGWAVTEEIRDAVLHFRAADKPAVFFAETFGELTPAHGGYHLATAFDEIIMQPSGDLGIAPLSVEAPFIRDALDRLDIIPRFDGRWEYKDAADMLERDGFSDDSREAMTSLLTHLQGRMLEGMSEGRGLSADEALERLAGGPYGARRAQELGLVDRLGYRDESRDAMTDRVGDDATTIGLTRYRDRGELAWNRGTRVALIYGVGPIQRGQSEFSPFGSGGLASGTVARSIRQAAEDPSVRAILFRVDSPGGSYVASDEVRREVRRARDNGTPVVVSMGNAAASGGYLISVDANRIVAQPNTITGSIGVVAGKLVTEEFFERFGIHWDQVTLAEDGVGGFFSSVQDFSESDWEHLQRSLDRIYDEFVDYVAEGRGMDPAAVDAVARGRVWTGVEALEAGLVDELGGFPAALGQIREILELEPDAPMRLTVYPTEPTLLQLFMDEGRGIEARASAPSRLLRGTVRLLTLLGSDGWGEPATVRMPELRTPGG